MKHKKHTSDSVRQCFSTASYIHSGDSSSTISLTCTSFWPDSLEDEELLQCKITGTVGSNRKCTNSREQLDEWVLTVQSQRLIVVKGSGALRNWLELQQTSRLRLRERVESQIAEKRSSGYVLS